MKEVETEGELYDLWVLLAMTRDAIYRATKEELTKYNLTPIRSAVLLLINFLGSKATPPEISRCLLRKRNSVSELFTRMERAGLVKKFNISPKSNLIRYELTEKGHDLYLQTTHLKTVEYIFSAVSEEKRQQLQLLLQALFKKAIEELKIESDMPSTVISK